MEKPAKPVPVVNSWTNNFWQAAKEGRLLLQKCNACHQPIFYPRMSCPFCFSDQLDWVEAAGTGSIYSYTVVRNNAPSAFIDDMPFVIAVVRLDEGVQMLSNIVDCDPENIYCEMPVKVTFEKLNEEFTLPKFKPVTS